MNTTKHQLTIPDPQKHQYVIGIDFGHGETSAAICELEWDKEASQREGNVLDLDMDRKARLKVIPSAICHANGSIFIGDEAFEYMTDNEGSRISFKQKPETIEGKQEKLMIDYMRAIYGRIREFDDRLTDTNHIVYIARPSGWQDEDTKELYRQMAMEAGIPLGGLTSESRAAIFYAKGPRIGFANEISRGALVFDLGSSTLDITYLSDTESAIDNGFNLGASIIDDIIYQEYILKSEGVRDFVEKYPEYIGALLFKSRKFKEFAYGRSPELKSSQSFDLDQIIQPDEEAYEEFGDEHVKLKISNIEELNNLIEEKSGYISRMRDALVKYRNEDIPGRTINGVFLTGGASRMNFIRSLIAQTLEIEPEKVKYDPDNPSLTISRGIALLGVADAITYVLVTKLREAIYPMINDEKLASNLAEAFSENISKEVWKQIETSCKDWVKYARTTEADELKKKVLTDLETFKGQKLDNIVNKTLQNFIKDQTELVRVSMNDIISRYAPGQEITIEDNFEIGDYTEILKSLNELKKEIADICKDMSSLFSDILWKMIDVLLGSGLLGIPYQIIKSMFVSDERKRVTQANNLLERKREITANLKKSIKSNLLGNPTFESQMPQALKSYFETLIETNLKKVIIPIE